MTRHRGHLTVTFWLKPHLHSLCVHLCDQSSIDVKANNMLGSFAMACLTPKHRYSDLTAADFSKGRKAIAGQLAVEHSRRTGFHVHSFGRFEDLVQHLFYHMMLTYVDAKIDHGVPQNQAIRCFLDEHNIDVSSVEIPSLKKTIIRRRKRMMVRNNSRKAVPATI